MREMTIKLNSVRDVQEFVDLSTSMGFPVLVTDGRHRVSGNSFMEMFCLDCSGPLLASADCSADQFEVFRESAKRFLAQDI